MASYPSGKWIVPHEWRCRHVEQEHPHCYLRPEHCPKCTADESVEAYYAVKAAYTNGFPLMDDKQFDKWESRLRSRWPDDERFWTVGNTTEEI